MVDRSFPLTSFSGVFVYKLALTALARINSVLADDLHSPKPFKPIVCSGVRVGGKLLRHGAIMKPEVTYSTKIALLDDVAFKALLKSMFSKMSVRIPAANVFISSAEVEVKNLQSLIGESDLRIKKFRVDFLSPTQLGKAVQIKDTKPIFRLFPDPSSLFRNLARYWNAFSREKIDVEKLVFWIENRVHECAYSLRTVPVVLGESRRTIGFMGYCEYEIRDYEQEEIKWLLTLLKFSKYAGVGKHRALGMGEVDIKYLEI